jgi:predicted amidohydrolase YtcJ
LLHCRQGGRSDPRGRNDDRTTGCRTRGSAYLLHDEANRGSLSPGLAADLVVFGRNLFETPPLEIHDVPVDMTVIDGKVVFERNPR